MSKFETPAYDDCMKELGWMKFEDNPVYYRREAERDRYAVTFTVDFKAYQKLYEDMVNDGKGTKEQLLVMLSDIIRCAGTIVYCKTLELEILFMLTADFYLHNRDNEMHQKYKDLYEQLSGRKY